MKFFIYVVVWFLCFFCAGVFAQESPIPSVDNDTVGSSSMETLPVKEVATEEKETVPAPVHDTIYIETPAENPQVVQQPYYQKPRDPRLQDMGFLKRQHEKFQGMQKGGFGLLMTGIISGVGGIVLMVSAVNSIENDPYGPNSGPPASFLIGYFGFIGSIVMIPTGIVLNRIGAGRVRRYQGLIDDLETNSSKRDMRSKIYLQIQPNALKLAYQF